MLKRKKEFVAALAVVVIVFVMLALPYALTEAYGLKAKKLILLTQLVVLVVFSAGMLIWWLVRYRQTSHDIECFGRKLNGLGSFACVNMRFGKKVVKDN